jgi:hypothetical protein
LERIYDSNAATVLTLVEIIAEKFRGATRTAAGIKASTTMVALPQKSSARFHSPFG